MSELGKKESQEVTFLSGTVSEACRALGLISSSMVATKTFLCPDGTTKGPEVGFSFFSRTPDWKVTFDITFPLC